MSGHTVILDVRDELRLGGAPLPKIPSVVEALRQGEHLRLLAPFEPKPLFEVLTQHRSHH